MLNDDDHRTMRDCKRSVTLRAQCDRCGCAPDILHLPLLLHRFSCGICAKACNPPGGAPTVPSALLREPHSPSYSRYRSPKI